MFGTFIVLISLIFFLAWIKKVLFPTDPYPDTPGPPQEFFIGNFRDGFKRENRKKRHLWFHQLLQQYGDIVKLKFFGRNVLLTSNPDLAKEIYAHQRAKFEKQVLIRSAFDFMPESIFVIAGSEWQHRRETVNPQFGLRHLRGSSDIIVEKGLLLMSQWEASIDQSQRKQAEIDVSTRFSRLTLDVISKSAFGFDLKALTDDNSIIAKDIRLMFDEIDRRMKLPGPAQGYWKYYRRESDRKFYNALKELKDFLQNLMDNKVKDTTQRDDLMSLLLEIREKENLSPESIMADLLTFLAAGNHTTAMSLSWIVAFLATHKDKQAKIQQEVDEILKGENPNMDNVVNLKYTTCFIKEVMRLKPVAWVSSRQAMEDVKIENPKLNIPKDSIVILNFYSLHRDPKYWKDPEEFIPERFDSAHSSEINSWSYMPFSKGMRNCIGQKLAMLELQIVTALLMQRFHLELAIGHSIRDKIDFTLVPDQFLVNVTRREK